MRPVRAPLLLLAGLLLPCAAPLLAQAPRLVKDIDPRQNAPRSSSPAGFVASGSSVWFRATTPETGQELFRSDGTGVTLAKDTLPGQRSGVENAPGEYVSFPPEAVDAAGTLFFTASDGRGGRTLWRADDGGIAPVVDLSAPNDAAVRSLTASGRLVYFTADTAAGTFLHVSDGTAAGTHAIAPVDDPSCGSGSCSSVRTAPASAEGLYFTKGAYAISRTEGREGDATLVFDGAAIASPNSIGPLRSAGETLFFTIHLPGGGWRLWALGGATAPRDLGPAPIGVAEMDARAAVILAPRLVYRGADGTLWSSDGTPAGTRSLGVGGVLSVEGPVAGHVLVLVAAGPGTDLWSSDGTPGGTVRVTAISGGRLQARAVAPGGTFLFFSSPASGPEVWWTDGTAAGTRLVGRFVGRYVGAIGGAAALDTRALFSACDADHGCEPWVADAASGTVRLLADLSPENAAGSSPDTLRDVGGRLFFAASDAEHGRELWTTDGSADGTHLVRDAAPGPATPGTIVVYPLGGAAYVLYATAGGGELWRTDGTAAGSTYVTGGVTRVFPGDDALWLQLAMPYAPGVPSLFRLTESGLARIQLFDVGAALTPVLRGPGGSFLFFSVRGNASTLWRSDGTEAGTAPVVTLPGAVLASEAKGGVLAFALAPQPAGPTPQWTLFASDGTAAGTRPLVPDSFVGRAKLAPRDGGLLVAGDDQGTWAVAAGRRTALAAAAPDLFTPSDSILYFAGTTGEAGRELWRTDGTPAGTRLAADLAPGPESSNPSSLVPLGGGRVAFSAETPATGRELFVSDGTAAGTLLVSDIRPGPVSGVVFGPVLSGGLLYVTADDGTTGTELWAVPVDALPCEPGPCRVAGPIGGGPGPVRR